MEFCEWYIIRQEAASIFCKNLLWPDEGIQDEWMDVNSIQLYILSLYIHIW